ncbi:hypothetical protein CLAFUW4_09431 [Fulvia fulva]|uniref:ATPase inhibitor, mitochondrial n=1 Tax=Passalora fulva TaxID=5499 RepID=A0A9Q8UTF1_PASFU|nr:uncharacterized protein CLAFUR5_09528 [Fulvia fulva]KAK4613397.1 hypothetical protein CLAFUR4_09437 [Fulvia fulva]KAK4614640.1 hypothetical protein CLAFUR0_09428 [Fulvia fulva]UJO21806.1 hypothetical protein CLAFUR5_09528 [Fulvia fulva]WPV20756.1 hypothetical protein CLAFUW4_09431 [Fulvia fulva]WPV35026.1 hypothetical protein CLAFUW7_09432 [Fulvia fulva]
MSALRIVRQLPRSTATIRSFSAVPQRMAGEGSNTQSDAFSKREKANEDYYVREEEKKKLEALKKRIADKEADLAKDRKDMEDLSGEKK